MLQMCFSCFGYKVKQECNRTHGIQCSSECEADFYNHAGSCRPCCHCTAGYEKVEGCRNSPSQKYCGIGDNVECKQPVETQAPSTQSSSSTTMKVDSRAPTTSSSTTKLIVTRYTNNLHTTKRSTKEKPSQSTSFASNSTTLSRRSLTSAEVTTRVVTNRRAESTSSTKEQSTARIPRKSSNVSKTDSASTVKVINPNNGRRGSNGGVNMTAIIVSVVCVVVLLAIAIAIYCARKHGKCCFKIDNRGPPRRMEERSRESERVPPNTNGASRNKPQETSFSSEATVPTQPASLQDSASKALASLQDVTIEEPDDKETQQLLDKRKDTNMNQPASLQDPPLEKTDDVEMKPLLNKAEGSNRYIADGGDKYPPRSEKCIWDVEYISLHFKQIQKMLPDLKGNSEDIYRLLTGDNDLNSGVSSTDSLYHALRTREPSLTVASFLYAVQTSQLYNVVKEMHNALHG